MAGLKHIHQDETIKGKPNSSVSREGSPQKAIKIYTAFTSNEEGDFALGVYVENELSEDTPKIVTSVKTGTNKPEAALSALVLALPELGDVNCPVVVHTPSDYVAKGVNGWAQRWQENGWKTARGSNVKNKDLWQLVLVQTKKHTNLKIVEDRFVPGDLLTALQKCLHAVPSPAKNVKKGDRGAEAAENTGANNDADKDERLKKFIEKSDRLDKIELDVVLSSLGAEPNQDNDPTKWKLPNGNNLWHKKNTQGWKDLNAERGGVGGVRLVSHALQMRPGEAVRWLQDRFEQDGTLKSGVAIASVSQHVDPDGVSSFRAPSESPRDLFAVTNYLVSNRGLPPSLVDREVGRGFLYAHSRPINSDATDDEKVFAPHCVFSGDSSAEIRCIMDDGFKGTAGGSDPEASGYKVPYEANAKEPMLCITEAAIDALSYNALFPGRFVTSTNGAHKFKLQFSLVLEGLSIDGFGVRLALDADPAGDMASQAIFNALYATKTLSKKTGLEEFEIEDLFLSGGLVVSPDNSPDCLFFGASSGFQSKFPISVAEIKRVTKPNGQKTIKKTWEDTGRMGPPRVSVKVCKSFARYTAGDVIEIPVSEAGYNYIVDKMKVKRDRPPLKKDWNDELISLGVSYVTKYEEAAKNSFADISGLLLPPSFLPLVGDGQKSRVKGQPRKPKANS